MSRPPLAIVMPVYNEKEGLAETLRSWTALVLEKIPGAVLFAVDDGSTDGSGAVIDALAAQDPRIVALHQANGGHGAAIVTGYRAALARGADWIFQTDSDGQFVPEQFAAAWDRRSGAAAVIGRRIKRPDSPVRVAGGWMERAFLRLMFGVRLPDPNCGFRLMRRDLLERALALTGSGDTAPNIGISVVAARLYPDEFRTAPVECRPRPFGVSSLNFRSYLRAVARTARQVLAFRRRLGEIRPQPISSRQPSSTHR